MYLTVNQEFKRCPKLEKWLSWIEVIESEISHLLGDAEIFHRVQGIIGANPRIQKPHAFYRYLQFSYLSHVLMGLRRQIKRDKNSVSFVRLLDEIAAAPEKLSRSYYRSLCSYPNGPYLNQIEIEGRKGLEEVVIANASQLRPVIEMNDFARYADSSGMHVCPRMVRDDLDKLNQATKACEEYADRRIAHRDTRQPKMIETFVELEAELNKSLKLLQDTYEKYYLLFHAASITVKPVYQGDWKAIFSEPWMATV